MNNIVIRRFPFHRIQRTSVNRFHNGIIHIYQKNLPTDPYLNSVKMQYFSSTTGLDLDNVDKNKNVTLNVEVGIDGKIRKKERNEGTQSSNMEKKDMRFQFLKQGRRNNRNLFSLRSRRSQKRNNVVNGIPTNPWLFLPRVPQLSCLEDILYGIEYVIQQELERGILDLDALSTSFVENVKTDVSPIYWDPSNASLEKPYPSHFVLEARSYISRHSQRPCGWFLRFPNRSMVHAIMEHSKHVEPLYCGDQKMTPSLIPCTSQSNNSNDSSQSSCPHVRAEESEHLCLDDSVIRMERVPNNITSNYLLEMFRNYELNHYGARPPIEECKYDKHSRKYKTFWIRFISSSEARAAIRQFQSWELPSPGRHDPKGMVTLIQHPRQIIPIP